jgi:hypothetical protein
MILRQQFDLQAAIHNIERRGHSQQKMRRRDAEANLRWIERVPVHRGASAWSRNNTTTKARSTTIPYTQGTIRRYLELNLATSTTPIEDGETREEYRQRCRGTYRRKTRSLRIKGNALDDIVMVRIASYWLCKNLEHQRAGADQLYGEAIHEAGTMVSPSTKEATDHPEKWDYQRRCPTSKLSDPPIR